ncbi:MAG: hypothetical protein FWE04_00615 [Oscillospiraceae bacterium]|nr:hypothetical protein [Oscillospiraceae bacterium]
MAKNLEEIKNKQERNRERQAAKNRLTNWYMINMTWAFVSVIVLQFIINGYHTMGLLLHMNLIMRIVAGVFALGGGVLVYLWIKGGRAKPRFFNYAIFSWAIAAVALLISFFAPIRLLFVRMGLPHVFTTQFPRNMIWGIMMGIGLWLIIALVIYIIKIRKL